MVPVAVKLHLNNIDQVVCFSICFAFQCEVDHAGVMSGNGMYVEFILFSIILLAGKSCCDNKSPNELVGHLGSATRPSMGIIFVITVGMCDSATGASCWTPPAIIIVIVGGIELDHHHHAGPPPLVG